MSDKPVWMWDWTAIIGGNPESALRTGTSRTGAWFQSAEECKLAAAAPQLVRALLAVEWQEIDPDPYPSYSQCVANCDGSGMQRFHHRDCPVDQALIAAGFPTQESRDAARRMMAEGKR